MPKFAKGDTVKVSWTDQPLEVQEVIVRVRYLVGSKIVEPYLADETDLMPSKDSGCDYLYCKEPHE